MTNAQMFVRQRLLNGYEEVTYDALRRVCETDGARVFPKVRIADVFRIENTTITPAHLSYALKAHFDFLVTDSDYQPLFSVEYDGPLHQTDDAQRKRDVLKNELCDHFHHGLLRINSRYLTPNYRGLDLLTYFVDAWFLEKAFSDAQDSGSVPYDEPFDMALIYSTGQKDSRKWPYWLSLDIQLELQKLHAAGRIGQMAASRYVGTDDAGNYRCLAWLVIDATKVLAVATGMRAQRFPAVCKSQLIGMLAMFDLHSRLHEVLGGNTRGVKDRSKFFAEELPAFEKKYEMCSATSCGATV
jgi:hypothetical protein